MRKKALEQVFICRESLPSHSEWIFDQTGFGSSFYFCDPLFLAPSEPLQLVAAGGVAPGPADWASEKRSTHDRAAAEDSEPRSKLIEKPLRFNQ